MQIHRLMPTVGGEMARVVRGVRPDQLAAPTPCPDFDVRALADHLLRWAPALEAAARRAPACAGAEGGLTGGDWQSRYVDRAVALAEAWSDPHAWEGSAAFAGGELPASTVGAMSFTELVVHAWDLARATGQQYRCDDDVAQALHQVMSRLGEQGRAMGAFGDVVPVPQDAPALDRALGLAGRDPAWPAGPEQAGPVVLHVTMSLDGFVAGPDVSTDNPMGEGGLRLHEWIFDSEANAVDAAVVRDLFASVGAVVLGRRTFDVGVGVWGDTPFPVPSFVVTHRPHDDMAMTSGTFTFVTDGVESAVRRARAAAGHRNVNLMGADVAQQAIRAGLLDEIHLQIAPVLLGAGRRLFDRLGADHVELERLAVVESPHVTHLRFRVRR